MRETSDIETELPDLTGISLADLAGMCDELAPYRKILIGQVEKPRPNIGTGPPGRAD